jgi:hypothetical protein
MLPANRPDREVGWPRAVQTGIAILGACAFGAVALSYGYGFGGGGRTDTYPQSAPSGEVDLAQLPAAAEALRPLYHEYEALNVRSAAANTSYNDPVTNTRVWKITDADTPSVATNTDAFHDYSEGGPFISREWGDEMHTICHIYENGGGARYCVDFQHGVGTSNWRASPAGELEWAFSYNENTPQIGYYIGATDGIIYRYDTAGDSAAPSGNFPKTTGITGAATWFQIDVNDRWMVWAKGDTVAAYDAVGDSVIVQDAGAWGAFDEPHIDRDGGYVLILVGTSSGLQHRLWNLSTGAVDSLTWYSQHPAGVRGYFVSYNSDGTNEADATRYDPSDTTGTVIYDQQTQWIGGHHRAGQWDQGVSTTAQYILQVSEANGSNQFANWVTATSWDVASGDTYCSASLTYTSGYELSSVGVNAVYQYSGNQIDSTLTSVGSIGAITRGTFFYDSVGDSLCVAVNGGGTPSGKVYMQAAYDASDGIVLSKLDGTDQRLLVHHYGIDEGVYNQQIHATLSVDGHLVMFKSRMNDSDGRVDVMVAEVPRS